MLRDHEQLEKVINNLLKVGVRISKTKSRLELMKGLEEVEATEGYSEYHS